MDRKAEQVSHRLRQVCVLKSHNSCAKTFYSRDICAKIFHSKDTEFCRISFSEDPKIPS